MKVYGTHIFQKKNCETVSDNQNNSQKIFFSWKYKWYVVKGKPTVVKGKPTVVKGKPTGKSNSIVLLHLNLNFAKLAVVSDSRELDLFMITESSAFLITFLKA